MSLIAMGGGVLLALVLRPCSDASLARPRCCIASTDVFSLIS